MKRRERRMHVELSPRSGPRRGLTFRVAASLVFLVASSAVVNADPPHVFAPGETLTAANLNAGFAALDQRVSKLEKGPPHAVVWRDRLGAVVPVVYIQPTSVIPFDLAWVADSVGEVWQVSLSSGALSGAIDQNVLYASSDCTGPAYVDVGQRLSNIIVPPRFPFTIPGDTTYYVLPDNPPPAVALASWSYKLPGTACQVTSNATRAVPLSAAVPATAIVKPADGTLFAAPAHPEYGP
jgi:hypothetical protein